MIQKATFPSIVLCLILTACGGSDDTDSSESDETSTAENNDIETSDENDAVNDLPYEDKIYYVEDFLELHRSSEAEDDWNGLPVKIWGIISQDTEGGTASFNDSSTYSIHFVANPTYFGKDSSSPYNWTNSIYFDPAEYLKDSTLVWEKGDTVTISAVFMNHWAKGPGFERAKLIEE